MTVWVRFMDMHSGGRTKVEPYEYIYIEADSEEHGRALFERLFHRDPEHVTCECCGADYSVSVADDLAQATAYNRHCAYDHEAKRYSDTEVERFHAQYYPGEPVTTVDDYCAQPNVKVLRWEDWAQ